MEESKTISAKIPDAVYKEMLLRIPEGDRSDFIRDAIIDRLQNTPKSDRILVMEERLEKVETEVQEVRRYLGDLELLTHGETKTNPRSFCIDDLDRKLIDYLMHYRGGTTPELADYAKTNRWMILNRLRRMQKASQRQTGKLIVEYYAGQKSGKKKAWWINEEIIEQ